MAPRDLIARRDELALQHRMQAAIAGARRLLAMPEGPIRDDDLPATIAALVAHLDDPSATTAQRAHEQMLESLRRRFEDRLDALGRVHAAAHELRTITSPSALLEAAAGVLCDASRFERVVVSHVSRGALIPAAVRFRGDDGEAAAVLAALRAEPVRLEHPVIELEILRRKRATIVADAHLHPRVDRRLAELMGWRSYVAAPVRTGSRIVAMIHADRGRSSLVEALDRDVAWEFATAAAQAHESAALRRTLRHERSQLRQLLERLNARSARLNDASVQLMPLDEPPDPEEVAGPASTMAGLARLLTPRELEVLQLLAQGMSNRDVATELVLSEGTVKFHVNSVLRKLRVTNRAEAVARYLSMGGKL
jgi:LuxR family transcriptional regulator, regulator of acetate metabolism